MQFAVGQKIFGRSTKYCYYSDMTWEVEEFIIDKVGTEYIYVTKEGWPVSIQVHKDSLISKDYWREIEFFSSIQAMQEHDEEVSLFRELRMTLLSHNIVHELGVEKLRAIKALLDDSSNSAEGLKAEGRRIYNGQTAKQEDDTARRK